MIDLVLKDVELGRYARERIDHKLTKAVERYPRELQVRVSLEENRGVFNARVMTSVNGRELFGHHESRSKLEALDHAIFKFDRQLLKLSDRQVKKPKSRRADRGIVPVSDTLMDDGEVEAAGAFGGYA